MSRRTTLMFVLTAMAAILWSLHLFTNVLSTDLTDFLGGLTAGLGIGAAVAWAVERQGR